MAAAVWVVVREGGDGGGAKGGSEVSVALASATVASARAVVRGQRW